MMRLQMNMWIITSWMRMKGLQNPLCRGDEILTFFSNEFLQMSEIASI